MFSVAPKLDLKGFCSVAQPNPQSSKNNSARVVSARLPPSLSVKALEFVLVVSSPGCSLLRSPFLMGDRFQIHMVTGACCLLVQ
jgi:hypothetical protein